MNYPPRIRATLDPLRDKRGACWTCSRDPAPGKKWNVCARCRATLYCSRRCQSDDWQMHKIVCEQPANGGGTVLSAAFGLTALSPHTIPLHDFVNLHSESFKLLVRMMRWTMLNRPVDPSADAVRIDLLHREAKDDHPATRFGVQRIAFIGVGGVRDLLAASHPRYSEGQLLKGSGIAQDDHRIIGHVQVVCVCDDMRLLFYVPLFLHSPDFEALQQEPMNRRANLRALASLKDGIERGKVLARLPEHKMTKSRMCVYGEMCREGKVWVWRECAPEVSELRL